MIRIRLFRQMIHSLSLMPITMMSFFSLNIPCVLAILVWWWWGSGLLVVVNPYGLVFITLVCVMLNVSFLRCLVQLEKIVEYNANVPIMWQLGYKHDYKVSIWTNWHGDNFLHVTCKLGKSFHHQSIHLDFSWMPLLLLLQDQLLPHHSHRYHRHRWNPDRIRVRLLRIGAFPLCSMPDFIS